MQDATELYKPKHKIRFVTATSLFDGHDVSINIIRRILQASGAEVIHLGHNRSVDEIVTAAIQEDAHGICISSYQGGHVAFSNIPWTCCVSGMPDISRSLAAAAALSSLKR